MMATKAFPNKKIFYQNLSKESKKSKGHIRAFIGAYTWKYEKELKNEGISLPERHERGFEKALEEAEMALNLGNFNEKLNSAIEEWRSVGEVLDRSDGCAPQAKPPLQKTSDWEKNGKSVVSLFSGALGLDLGFLAEGFDLKLANDIEDFCKNTVEANLPEVPFIHGDSNEISANDLLNKTGLDVGEIDVLIGGPPCQPYSTAGKREGLNDPRSAPIKDFVRLIKKIKPKVFVMEEVTGLLNARLKHVTIQERKNRELKPEEEKGSAFEVIEELIESTGYNFTYEVLNAADFGTPQVRKRLVVLGVKSGQPSLPDPTHTDSHQKELNNDLEPWSTFWEATADLQGGKHTNTPLSEKRSKYMKKVPPGGHWRHLTNEEQKEALGGAYESGGGRMGYFRRLNWDEPSPTVVTSPSQKGTMLCHPEEQRYISIEEYKRLQGFPDDWELVGGKSEQYKMIGNAVPVHLSQSVAAHVKDILENEV